jgi:uncharacterized protein (DUF1800 family)
VTPSHGQTGRRCGDDTTDAFHAHTSTGPTATARAILAASILALLAANLLVGRMTDDHASAAISPGFRSTPADRCDADTHKVLAAEEDVRKAGDRYTADLKTAAALYRRISELQAQVPTDDPRLAALEAERSQLSIRLRDDELLWTSALRATKRTVRSTYNTQCMMLEVVTQSYWATIAEILQTIRALTAAR